MKKIAGLLSILALGLMVSNQAQADESTKPKSSAKIGGPFKVQEIKDIAYREDKDADPVKHKLDLFLPKDQKDYPVFFFIHGGAWVSGDRKLYGGLGHTLAKNGIAAVIISYRLTPKVQHPGHIEDVAKAFAWTHQNIKKYGGRPDQIFVSGHSAGGHLSALLATNDQYLKAEKLSIKDIKAAIPMSGIYIMQGKRMERILGPGQEAADNASPIKHVTGKEPPFLILYADQDFPTCDLMSKGFREKLDKAKVPASCLEITDRSHVSVMVKLMVSEEDPATQAILEFVAKHSDLKLHAK